MDRQFKTSWARAFQTRADTPRLAQGAISGGRGRKMLLNYPRAARLRPMPMLVLGVSSTMVPWSSSAQSGSGGPALAQQQGLPSLTRDVPPSPGRRRRLRSFDTRSTRLPCIFPEAIDSYQPVPSYWVIITTFMRLFQHHAIFVLRKHAARLGRHGTGTRFTHASS